MQSMEFWREDETMLAQGSEEQREGEALEKGSDEEEEEEKKKERVNLVVSLVVPSSA